MREGETYQQAVLKSYAGPLLLFSSVLVLNPDSYLLLYALSLSLFFKKYIYSKTTSKHVVAFENSILFPCSRRKVFQDP